MFHVFAGSNYYPLSGLGDYLGVTETFDDALELVANTQCDWWTIASLADDGALKVVKERQ